MLCRARHQIQIRALSVENHTTRIVIEQGIRWDDLFLGTSFDFFTRYLRRFTAPI